MNKLPSLIRITKDGRDIYLVGGKFVSVNEFWKMFEQYRNAYYKIDYIDKKLGKNGFVVEVYVMRAYTEQERKQLDIKLKALTDSLNSIDGESK